MPLLIRTTARDSWGEMEAAARHRYFDGMLLGTTEPERFTGALYLLGYVAEILIKTAYYRLRGLSILDDVAPELAGMPARAATLGLRCQGNRHNLESLANLLVLEREAAGLELDSGFAGEFQAHVADIGAHWSEVLRYKDVAALESELAEAFASVEWLIANYLQLWSR